MTQLELFTERDFEEDPTEQRKRYLLNAFRCKHHLPIFSPSANMSLYKHRRWCIEEMRKLDYLFHNQVGKPNCKKCKYFVLSTTPSSPNKPILHCRCGFNPHNNINGCCIDDCTENDILSGNI